MLAVPPLTLTFARLGRFYQSWHLVRKVLFQSRRNPLYQATQYDRKTDAIECYAPEVFAASRC